MSIRTSSSPHRACVLTLSSSSDRDLIFKESAGELYANGMAWHGDAMPLFAHCD